MQIEPPDEGANARTASLMAQITNMAGRALRDRKMVKPSDFLGKPTKQTEKEQQDFFRNLSKD